MSKQRNVAIVHFNTPELTEACVWSIRRHGGEHYHVTILDNSNSRPFVKKMDGVTVINNRDGQIVDFDRELARLPKCPSGTTNNYGSVRHMMSVQALWDLIPDGFLLLDSDVLLKASVEQMFRDDVVCVGHVQQRQPGNRFGIPRTVPMLCYINVPLCRKYGLRYFDERRTWMTHSDSLSDRYNWYDTGAAFYEDIHNHKNGCRGMRIDIRPLMEHYKKGSWSRNSVKAQQAWLDERRRLWWPTPAMRGIRSVAICAIARRENRYAREWVEHYRKAGVQRIFIYDNHFGDEEPIASVLQDYVRKGLVEITDLPDRKAMQCRAYEDCYRKHGDEYAWIGFLDMDEYVRWKGRQKIEAMMAAYATADDGTTPDVVLVNWRTMTDGGATRYDERPLAKRFTEPMMPLDKCVKYAERPENDHVKCFVRGGIGSVHFGKNPHSPSDALRAVNTEGKRVRCSAFTPFTHKVMRIDHYWTKTAEEWIGTKLVRGFPSGRTYISNFLKEQEDYFFAVNERTEEKERIIRDGLRGVTENMENIV